MFPIFSCMLIFVLLLLVVFSFIRLAFFFSFLFFFFFFSNFSICIFSPIKTHTHTHTHTHTNAYTYTPVSPYGVAPIEKTSQNVTAADHTSACVENSRELRVSGDIQRTGSTSASNALRPTALSLHVRSAVTSTLDLGKRRRN